MENNQTKQTNQPKMEWEINTKKFKHKITGEIKTRLNIFELNDFEEVKQ